MQLAQNGSVVIAGVVSGSAQVGLPTPTVAFQAVENGLPLQAFASTNVFPDTTAAGLVVGMESGIRQAKDLEGKKVGVPGLGGLLDVTMRKWVSSNGADISKVNIVEIQLPQTADALRAKQVDAVASVDPFASRAVDTGAGTLIGNYFDVITPGTAAGIYVTTKDWADANPDAVKGMQLALDEALAFIKDNDKAARESIAKYTTLPPPVVANMKMSNLATHLDPEKSFRFWNDLAKKQGLIKADIDLNAFTIKYPGE
ncbi:ABC transporter substrate-binding protein [Shinella sp.]|uniref:ABC transporter substrate-binding protein n=1 Tax=Shinella sp. TaxID=1870904 RepID=UPI0025843459|nr:ABC transporter substrate-binding protein [Shinella sp.]